MSDRQSIWHLKSLTYLNPSQTSHSHGGGGKRRGGGSRCQGIPCGHLPDGVVPEGGHQCNFPVSDHLALIRSWGNFFLTSFTIIVHVQQHRSHGILKHLILLFRSTSLCDEGVLLQPANGLGGKNIVIKIEGT